MKGVRKHLDLLKYQRTEYGNAERLHALHGHEFRYCNALGWLVWDGRRWQVDKDEVMMTRKALDAARKLFKRAGEDKTDLRDTLVKYALGCERKNALANAVSLAKSIPGVVVTVNELDADPMLLNVKNGTVDLRTGCLRPHDPDNLITKLAPVTYNADADCPRWDEFQTTISDGDKDLIGFKQRAYGYSVTGDTSEQALFIAYGGGSNGKSTELSVISGLLGEYADVAQFETFTAKKNEGVRDDLADLMGARFVSASEGKARQSLAEGLVKQMTGGDMIKARFLFKDLFSFKPEFKLWLATNHKPVIRGTDHGIWRRIRLIPYAVTFAKERQDKGLSEKLERERSGILNWLIAGCLTWQVHGLGEAEAVEKATESYRQESDVLADFLEARCIRGEQHTENSGVLYQAYQTWCQESGEEPAVGNTTLFGRMLSEHGHAAATVKIDGKAKKIRKGISLIENREGGSVVTGYR